jgi:mannose-6-phosphate isomerase-like protein (cupin superfamily)
MKVLTLNFERSCSMHFHIKKEEIFFVVSGSMLFDVIDTETGQIYTTTLQPGDTVHIPRGTPHKFTGAEEKGCVFIECSTEHFDDDSYRVAPGDSQCSPM